MTTIPHWLIIRNHCDGSMKIPAGVCQFSPLQVAATAKTSTPLSKTLATRPHE